MEEGGETSSPFLFSDRVYIWLDTALDNGITEAEFWDMTIIELNRAIESRERVKIAQQKEKAIFDYNLADLIGRSISRLYSATATMPDISTVYPTLFDSQEIKEQRQEKLNELSAIRFRQFAQSFNKQLKEVAKDNDE